MSILSVDTIQPIGSGSTVTLNAAKIVVGTGITFESNGQAIYAGIITATSFYGSGANLTSLPAGQLTGTVADARISTLTASKLSGALPAISGANLTSLPAQATISNNADNRVITGGSGVNLNGESGFTYDGTTVQIPDRINCNTNGTYLKENQLSFNPTGTAYLDHYRTGQDIQIRMSTSSSLDTTGPTFKSNGNLAFASGKGIDFSAASGSASGSASALLDDYEEGVWTATLSGNSSPTNTATNNPTTTRSVTGTYRKIGSLVHVQALWTGLQSGGGANDMHNHQLQHITGIPFTSGNASGTSVFTAPLGYSRGIYGRYSNSIIEECVLYFWLGTASTTVYMQASQIVQNSPGTLYHTVSNSSSSMYYAFNMTYHTN